MNTIICGKALAHKSAKMLANEEPSKPWVEKYRPRSISDVSGQDEIIGMLSKSLHAHNLPHLLFYGPPGTGKTSTIIALARQLFGPELMRQRVLELNASDERGISVVREKVKNFAMVSVRETVLGYPCPPFKIIILDEADSLTTDAQTALRRIMEMYSSHTRFCIICNYVSRYTHSGVYLDSIIDPITSRCAKFRFKQIANEAGLQKLRDIAQKEGTKEVLIRILEQCHGDLRRAITLLQGLHQLNVGIDTEFVQEMAGAIPQAVFDSFFALKSQSDVLPWHQQSIVRQGYSAKQALIQLSQLVLTRQFTAQQHARIALRIAEAEHALAEGADEFIQLLYVFLTLHQLLQ